MIFGLLVMTGTSAFAAAPAFICTASVNTSESLEMTEVNRGGPTALYQALIGDYKFQVNVDQSGDHLNANITLVNVPGLPLFVSGTLPIPQSIVPVSLFARVAQNGFTNQLNISCKAAQ